MIALTPTHSKTALLCVAFLLAGAGCEQKTESSQAPSEAATTEDVHAEHEDHDHEEHDHEHSHDEHDHAGHDHADMTTYNCQPEQTIEAHYDPEDSAQPATSAHLLIDGVEYDLTAMTLPQNNSTGAAYETDIGIANDAGMTWQLNADATKAVLRNKTLDGSVATEAEAVLFDCQKADS
ncbi:MULTISPECIES: hypothetical protein [Psychrobacter]|uniref:C-type lysozyme inhibitor domain-containing protein n=1 Tax=Psychrobacter alimentarius TaxID=261164 RepID=A0ABM5ZX10_9GAMM|nr:MULTISPECIES: hypothetical protein [Psychrobacter]AMT96589.1 hypothetical protein A3K91_0975 [Psychrobacter alimentarius]QCB31028.1 hypothetical protein E5677_08495 [Psychrobacter sp. PAMC27889]